MLREVVITGLGRVGPQGSGRSALVRALREGAPVPTRPCSAHAVHADGSLRPEPLEHAAHAAVSLAEPPSGDECCHAESMVRTAARLARNEAQLDEKDVAGELWVATSFGVPAVRPSPAMGIRLIENRNWVAATGSSRFGGQVVAREASGLLALAAAARAIDEGRTDRAIVVEVDAFGPALLRVHRRLRALARAIGGAPPIARPFDLHRLGTVLAEGATALVLERESAAANRGVTPRSRVGFAYDSVDGTAPPYGFGRGAAHLAEELREKLAEARIPLSSIDGVLAGARGSVEGDAQEAAWIATLFSERRLPPVFAPIGTTGLGGGGFLAASALAAEGVPLGGSAGFCQPDPRLPIRPHPSAISPTPGRLLVSTIASGGAAVWTILEAP
jgi:hypothetical protein